MTERYRAADVQIHRAQAHYAGLVEELTSRRPRDLDVWMDGRSRHCFDRGTSVVDTPERMGYVPRHAAEETP